MPQSACPKLGLVCEIGSDRNYTCNTLVTCTSNGWDVPLDQSCTGLPSTGCPPSSSQVPIGSACGATAACEYPDVLCECNSMGMPGPTQGNRWQCEAPATGCPRPRPHLGTTCAQESLVCDYGSCSLSSGLVEECQGGVWVQSSWACPL